MRINCGKNFRLFLFLKQISSTSFRSLLTLNKEYVTILIPLNGGFTWIGNQSYSEFIKESGFRLGYILPISVCSFYGHKGSVTRDLDDALANIQSSSIIFIFEEYKDTVHLGATRMFKLRKVLFENCQKIISKNKNASREIGFAMNAFYKGKHFYWTDWAMKNYVRYIDLLSDWADKQNDIVVFLGLDEDRSFDGDFKRRKWDTVGWYSYNHIVEKKGYKRKNETFLNMKISENEDSTFKKYFGLNSDQFIIALCAIFFFLAVIILAGIHLSRRRRIKYQLTFEEMQQFFDGQKSENLPEEQEPINAKYDKAKYEISERNFKVNSNELLGSGEYGKVFRGTVRVGHEETDVAIKTANPQKHYKTMINGLLSEIKVLAHVGQHPNITQLLGAHTSSIRTGKIYVFLELCSMGSLEKYLRKLSPTNLISETSTTQNLLKTDNKYANMLSDRKRLLDASLSNDFNRWSKEICSGMDYLAEKHVVHADLATRNVLLNSQREAKICDFGLSRRMYNYTSYVKSQQEPMPWRWMAPESLRYMVFDEKTDVWAFGITLWEIYSLGSTPYAGLSWDVNFVKMLKDGLIPSEPDYNEKNMYDMMKTCWRILPVERPSFADILSTLLSSEN